MSQCTPDIISEVKLFKPHCVYRNRWTNYTRVRTLWLTSHSFESLSRSSVHLFATSRVFITTNSTSIRNVFKPTQLWNKEIINKTQVAIDFTNSQVRQGKSCPGISTWLKVHKRASPDRRTLKTVEWSRKTIGRHLGSRKGRNELHRGRLIPNHADELIIVAVSVLRAAREASVEDPR